MNDNSSRGFEDLRSSVLGTPQAGDAHVSTPGLEAAAAPPSTAEPQAAGGGATAVPPGAAPDTGWLNTLLATAYGSRNWLKFLGIMSMISGGLAALTIVGLLFAWLYIWVGVLLWQAGDRATWAHMRRNPALLAEHLVRMKTVITICGVFVAVSLVLAVMAVGFFVTLGGIAALLSAVS